MTDPRWHRRSLLGASAALLLPGCGTGIVAHSEAGDALLRVRLEFIDPQLRPIPAASLRRPFAERTRMRHVRAPDPIELLFAAVPGRMAGPAAELLLRRRLRAEPSALEAESQAGFSVNLGYMGRGLARFATPLQSRPEDQGLRVEPSATRLARLALAPAEPGQVQSYPALCGFLDGDTGVEHLLVFVDRACRIEGRIDLRQTGTFVDAHAEIRRRFSGLYEHAVELPAAGLHWLAMHPAGERQWQVRRAEAPRSPFVYILDAGARLD